MTYDESMFPELTPLGPAIPIAGGNISVLQLFDTDRQGDCGSHLCKNKYIVIKCPTMSAVSRHGTTQPGDKSANQE
jgi:hypothetical protein